jgi:predicted acylesterase/phospholipase RssA
MRGFDADDLSRILLASSALPHGVFPPVITEKGQYVDGGVSDNLPVYPALKQGRICDLTIVRLWPHGYEGDAKQFCQAADRKSRLRTMSESEAHQLRDDALKPPGLFTGPDTRHYWPPKILPFNEPPYWPETILEIAPKQELGNIVTGTMNFSCSRSRRLLQCGWRDAREALGYPASVPESLPIEELLARS